MLVSSFFYVSYGERMLRVETSRKDCGRAKEVSGLALCGKRLDTNGRAAVRLRAGHYFRNLLYYSWLGGFSG